MYTNATASNLNLNLYSRQMGGTQCIRKCKTKCKDNCGTFCRAASDDKDEHAIYFKKLTDERDALKLKMDSAERVNKERLIRDYTLTHRNGSEIQTLLQNPTVPTDTILRYLSRGGFKKKKSKRNKRNRTKRKGGFFFGNTTELKPCEDDCTDSCSTSCELLCTNAISKTSVHKERVSAIKDEIALYKKIIHTLS